MSETRNPAGPPVTRSAFGVAFVVAIVSAAVAALLVWLPATGATTPANPATPASPGATTTVHATGHTTTVTVTAANMAFTPNIIDVPLGDQLTVTFVNADNQRHDLVFANGASSGPLAPGAKTAINVGVIGGPMDGWCSLPGHREMGMTLKVLPSGSGPPAATQTDNGMEGMNMGPAASPVTMAQLQQQAAASGSYTAELPEADNESEHFYTFTIQQQTQQIADGLTREIWTFGPLSPGPVLRGHVGDTFHIRLVNNGNMGHSIDFHAGEVAPDQPMRTIGPGESLDYTFTANRAGIWMYHCATMPMSDHIANGMFGAVIIDPDNLPQVDKEYVILQSELYLGADGQPADTAKVAAMTPDIVAFNGRAFQYDAHPLPAQVGDRVRFWVLDDGPNLPLAFHVVGAQFDTVWSEGAYSVYHGRSEDNTTRGTTGAQVLPLLPAQGGFVEMVPTEAGHYPFVNHVMSLAEKGAHGVLEVTG